MHNGLRPRFGPPDRIRYVLFAGPRVPLSIHIPDILSEGYLELLQLMPKATGQVINPIAWHKRARSVRCFRHVDFGVTFDDAPLPVIRAAITSAPTTVILLNSRLPRLWQAIRQQAATCLVCSADEQLGVDFSVDSKLTKIYCATFEQLIAKLMRRIARLSKSPAGVLEGLIENRIAELVSILERLNDRTSANFLACRPNDHTFLQLLAPYGRNILKLVEIAHAERPEALVKSALRILRNYNFLDKKVSRQGIGFPDYNPPLILSWPYYGPNHKELFKSLIKTETGERKAFLKTMGEVALGEQNPKNYDYRIRGLLLQNRAAVHAATRAASSMRPRLSK